MTKIVYSYDPVSYEYVGSVHADESPLEEGVYLVPAYATESVPPPVDAGFVAVFLDGAWELLQDVRGQYFDDQGRVVEVTTLDADLQGLTRTAPPDADHDLVAGQWVLNVQRRFATKAAVFKGAVQQHLDTVAQAQGYDGILSAVSYADEPAVPRFQAEGQAFRAWRSQVWAACYQLLDDVRLGHAPEPGTAADLIQLLPQLDLPE